MLSRNQPGYLIVIFSAISIFLAGCLSSNKKKVPAHNGPVLDAVTIQVNHGFVEGRIGQSMDKRDYSRLKYALGKRSKKIDWQNSTTKIKYHLSLRKAERNRSNKIVCRNYSIKARVDGFSQSTRGRACKNRQGRWTASYAPPQHTYRPRRTSKRSSRKSSKSRRTSKRTSRKSTRKSSRRRSSNKTH